jgi:23S rRNA (adenine2503-C2)-methyltransferase
MITNHATNLRDVPHDKLTYLVKEAGQPVFRVKQVEDWLWNKNVCSYEEMKNVPKALREALEAQFSLDTPVEVSKQVSSDGSRKYLLQFEDGTFVETVGMPSGEKLAVCLSTQAGCAMKCAFCATGKTGLIKSLSAAQMYAQVTHVARDFDTRVSSVVFMGQGEPFMNYDQTIAALKMLNRPDGLNIGARHLTVSTCGIVPKILEFAKLDEQYTLAISLHSTIQSVRDQLMPGVKKYTLGYLKDALHTYTSTTNRRPTYEYAMIDGITDTEESLDALVAFCEGDLCHVNLIRLNEIPSSPFKPSKQGRVQSFVNRLTHAGVETTVRESRGQDIDAACGMLSQKHRS